MSPLWALPLGLVVGLTLGALGGGGGILTVPALVYLLGQDPRDATTGSLIIVGASALVGLVPHRRAGHIRPGAGLVFGALGLAGSWVGSRLSRSVDPDVLSVAFAVLMLVVAALMVRKLRGSATAVPPHESTGRMDARRVVALVLTASGIGFLTGFFGVGGGFAVVPALTLVLGFPMRAAVGTSLVVIAVNSATALASRAAMGTGPLDWPLLATFGAGAIVGSLLGGRFSAGANPRHLGHAFIVMLVVIAAYMLFQNVPRVV